MKYRQKNPEPTTAWKYQKGADVPAWVARRCHDLGDGKLTANTLAGRTTIDEGDYVCLADEESGAIVVVDGKGFEAEFEPVPDTGELPKAGE